jgi:hypothetical protein
MNISRWWNSIVSNVLAVFGRYDDWLHGILSNLNFYIRDNDFYVSE